MCHWRASLQFNGAPKCVALYFNCKKLRQWRPVLIIKNIKHQPAGYVMIKNRAVTRNVRSRRCYRVSPHRTALNGSGSHSAPWIYWLQKLALGELSHDPASICAAQRRLYPQRSGPFFALRSSRHRLLSALFRYVQRTHRSSLLLRVMCYKVRSNWAARVSQ